MNKKVFVILLAVVVVVGFVVGFATAKEGDAEDITTTLPLIDVNDEPETGEFVEKDTESETETETTEETTEENTTESESGSKLIETRYFTLEAPADWHGEYSCEPKNQNSDGSYELVFTHPETKKQNPDLDATIFTILVSPQTENDNSQYIPNADVKGTLTVDGEKYDVILATVSDERYTEETKESYNKIYNGADEFMESLKPVYGVEYEPAGAKG